MTTKPRTKKTTEKIMDMTDVADLLDQARAILLSDGAAKKRAGQPLSAKLDRIFELQGTEREIAADIDAMVEKLQANRASLVKAVVEERDRLSGEVKTECLELKESAQGKYLQVIWCEGTRSWNSDGLEDYAKTHADVLNFRKQSAPIAKLAPLKPAKGQK